MPCNCCVPQCNSVNNKNRALKFHQFPKDVMLKKKWVVATKLGKKPSKYAKVCSKHFELSDYTSTSMDQWKILKKQAIPSLHLPQRRFDKLSGCVRENSNRTSRLLNRQMKTIKITSDIETEPCSSSFNLNNIGEDLQVQTEESTRERPALCNHISVNTQSIISLQRSQLISVSFLSDTQLKHFSGFYRNEFKLICDFFKIPDTRYNNALGMGDQILLTLMKFRHNYYYRSLEMLFDVSNRVVRKIINFWVNHMYVKLKCVNFWATKCKRSEGEYDVIIDCTEMPIERSKDPIIQQATYSQYKSTNTFKVLVGCTEYGAVIYVSDIYGGCISDRKITEESGFLNLLKKDDYVLADRGFNISDLLENKGVHINIPPFKTKKQLSELDVAKTRAIANRRIIIEQLNGLAKKNRIIVDKMPVHMWPLANQIVYICFMLTSFRKSIIWLK